MGTQFKMRVYNIIRFSNRVRYAEVSDRMKMNAMDSITIPNSIPTILHPFICVMGTANCENFKQIEIQDKNGKTWFELKSDVSIKKMTEYSCDMFTQMR